MADGLTFDKATYASGDKVTVTAVLSGRKSSTPVSFSAGSLAGLTGTLNLQTPGSISDSAKHVWTLVSDDGVTAVYTTVA